MVAMRDIACPVCDLKDAAPVFQEEGGEPGVARLVRCRGCGLAYLDPQPDPAEMAPFYAPDYYGGPEAKFEPWVESLRDVVARARARRLARGLPPGARVLDVGCGDGRLLAAFAALGHPGTGTERTGDHPCPGGAAAGLEIRSGDLPDAGLPAASFHLCVYWHVLEHLHDPLASLVEAQRLLVPGGRLVVAVPNFESLQAAWAGRDWFHLDLPRHLFHFTPRSLAALLVRAGFRVQRVGHYALEQNPYGILQSALNRAGRRRAAFNLLYDSLKGIRRDVSTAGRLALHIAFVLGMPVAACLATIESMIGRGGTIEVWAASAQAALDPAEETAAEPAGSLPAAPLVPLGTASRGRGR